MFSLNNVNAGTTYTAAQTLSGLPVCTRVNFDIATGPIYVQYAFPTSGVVPGGEVWSDEVYYSTSLRSLDRRFVGVRFRAATATGALVSVECLTESDIGNA